MPTETPEQGGDTQGVVDEGTDVRDPELERRKAGRRPQVPPYLRRVLDHSRSNEWRKCRAVIVPALEPLGDATARRGIVDGRSIRFRPVFSPCQNGDEVDRASSRGKNARMSFITP